jgi:hypothetical protein
VTSSSFEWAVTAAMSISAHLAERNYSLRLLDAVGDPAFRRSRSAPDPDAEEFSGAAGLHAIAEGLAAIQLTVAHHGRHNDSDAEAPRHQGTPLLALLGNITVAEARALAPCAAYGANAFAIIVTDHFHNSEPSVEALRHGGWRTVRVTSRTPLASAWSGFDQGEILLAAASAMDVRRGAAVPR